MDFKRVKVVVAIGAFLFSIGMGMHTNILPLYLKSLGASGSGVGVVFSLNGLLRGLVMVVGGYLMHRFSRKWVFVSGWIVAAIAGLIYAFVPTIWGVMIAAMMMGMSVISPIARSSMLMSLAPTTKDFREAMFLISMSFSAAFVIGPPIGGFVAWAFGWRWVFLTFTALVLVGTVLIVTYLPDVPPIAGGGSPAGILRGMLKIIKTHRRLIVGFLLIAMSGTVAGAVAPLLFKAKFHMDEREIGLISSLWPLGAFVLSMIVNKKGLTSIIASIKTAAGMVAGALAALLPVKIGAPLFYFLRGGSFMALSLTQATLGEVIEPEESGVAFTAAGALTSWAGMLGFLAGGWMYDRAPSLPFVVSAILGAGALLVLITWQKDNSPTERI